MLTLRLFHKIEMDVLAGISYDPSTLRGKRERNIKISTQSLSAVNFVNVREEQHLQWCMYVQYFLMQRDHSTSAMTPSGMASLQYM